MDIKKKIPNILTFSRLFFTLLILLFGLLKQFNLVLIFCIIASITDFFDGFLARKFKAITSFGAKLDAVVDKVFVICLLITLINTNISFLVLLLLEMLIGISNLYYYFKLSYVNSLLVGKIKTASLFVTIIIAYFHLFFNIPIFLTILNGFIYMTGNLQFLSFISYLEFFLENKNKKPVENISTDDDLEKTIYVNNLDDLLETGEEVI